MQSAVPAVATRLLRPACSAHLCSAPRGRACCSFQRARTRCEHAFAHRRAQDERADEHRQTSARAQWVRRACGSAADGSSADACGEAHGEASEARLVERAR
eukprot:1232547-Pleurochrysis_carterae.AAC.2